MDSKNHVDRFLVSEVVIGFGHVLQKVVCYGYDLDVMCFGNALDCGCTLDDRRVWIDDGRLHEIVVDWDCENEDFHACLHGELLLAVDAMHVDVDHDEEDVHDEMENARDAVFV